MTFVPEIFTDVSKSNWKPSEGTWLAAHEAKDAHILVTHTLKAEGHDASEDGTGRGVPLTVALRGRENGATAELGGEVATAIRASQGGGDKPHVLAAMAVRRLTPVECERLQGFDDEWTEGESDSARYRLLGNAVCVPVAEWIGRRIANA
jgi:DNA (cytosine-5)-methyltransferase 1